VIAGAAVSSLVVGIWNYSRNAEAQVEVMALGSLQSYLALAVEHPDLASWDDSQPVDARYAWFAAYALNTAQTLRALVGHDASWQRGIDAIIRQHRPYLRSGAFVCEDYNPEFVGYMRERVADLSCSQTSGSQ
jgi:hypothetical protein